MAKAILLVGLGGGIGSIFRYVTSLTVNKYFPNAFPIGTFMVNILGCFLIGLFLGLFNRTQEGSADLKLLFVTGFCGGFTTFSAFASENLSLLQSGHTGLAILYTSASIMGGLLAVWWGYRI